MYLKKSIKLFIKLVLGEKLVFNLFKLRNFKKIQFLNLINCNRIKDLKNKYNGKRCFILGNGPSLKDVDLSLLANEFVFTCNNFSKIDDYKKVKTNFHIWVDEAYFNLRNEVSFQEAENLQNFELISEEDPVCFVPDYSYIFFKNNGLNNKLNLNYFSIYQWINKENSVKTELDSFITGFTNVVQYAITIALYMGFSEIYLLGCDSTAILSMLDKKNGKQIRNAHAYGNDEYDSVLNKLLSHWKMTNLLEDQYTLFLGYEKLFTECKRRNVKIENLSNISLIDSIPKNSLNNVLGFEKQKK